ncbi:dynamin-3-like [Thalassophryne amazonica]|uniref:dynamin-3-like n=1 Tax=Thalassophryne amazonica TaxID=390379 RepID=UPI0014721D1A|nr:dynamin-3-like [Thalassophryne amazonica]
MNCRYVYKDYKCLELACNSQEELDSWKASLLRAAVYPENLTVDGQENEDCESLTDPHLQRQVETISNLVESYMNIIYKTIRDLVPKTIMHFMVNSLKEFMSCELLAQLYALGEHAALMDESPEQQQHRDEMLHKHTALKEALAVIGEISASICATLLPLPIHSSGMESGRYKITLRNVPGVHTVTKPTIDRDQVQVCLLRATLMLTMFYQWKQGRKMLYSATTSSWLIMIYPEQ